MSTKKLLLKNTSFNLLGYTYALIVSFIAFPLLLKYLGSANLGIYLLLASIVPIVSIFDFGLSQAVIRKLALPNTSKKVKLETLQTSFRFYLFTGITISLLVFVGIITFGQQYLSVFSLPALALTLATTVFLSYLSTHFATLAQADQRFDIYNIRTLLVGSNTLIAALVARSFPIINIIFAVQLITYVVSLYYLAIFAYKSLGVSVFKPNRNKLIQQDLLSFGLKHFLGTASGQVHANLSKYVLAANMSPSFVTIFTIPQTIIQKATGGISQLSLAFFPLSASLTSKNKIAKLKKLIISLEFFIAIFGALQFSVVKLYGYQFLLWWLKDISVVSFSYPVLQILSLHFILVSLTPIPSKFLDSIKLPHIPSYVSIAHLFIYAFFLFRLTPMYGVMGPAYAMLLTSALTVPPFLAYSYHRITLFLNQKT